MPIAVSIDSVTTGDAAPAVAPFRISAKPGKSTATIAFTPTTSDSSPIRAWRITIGGTRLTGRLAGRRGLVCGLDRCGPGKRALAMPSGTQVTEAVAFTEASDGGADGTREAAVTALSATQGWA